MKSLVSLILFAVVIYTACQSSESASIYTDLPESNLEQIDGMEIYNELFDDTQLHRFIVEITQEEWDGISQDMIDYSHRYPEGLGGQPYRTGNYRRARFIYLRPDGTRIIINDVGIRTRGNESRSLPMAGNQYAKTHFKIKFDETFNMSEGSELYEIRNDRRFGEMKALNFKWSRTLDWMPRQDSSHINEDFCLNLLEDIGVTAPRASLATLSFIIDGERVDYGLYTLLEHVDKPFLSKRYGTEGNDGNLYKCLYLGNPPLLSPESLRGELVGVKDWESNYRPIYDLKTNRREPDHTELEAFVENLNSLKGDEWIQYMEANFEVDKWLRYLAMGIYINNLDDYRFLINNYYLYFNSDGKIEFIPIDFDMVLSCGWDADLGWDGIIHQDIFNTYNVTGLWGETARRPLVDKFLEVPQYRAQYLNYLEEFINPSNELFLYSEFEKHYRMVESLYAGLDQNDTIHPDRLELVGFEKDYFEQKTADVLNQLQ